MRLVFLVLYSAMTTNFIRCETQMDISEWYSDMMSRGAFEGDLTLEQTITKNQISDMIKESIRTDTPKKVSLKTLANYESIFKVFELKDETEMDEEDPDANEEDTNFYAGYDFSRQNAIKSMENIDENDNNELKDLNDQRNELQSDTLLETSTTHEPKSSENLTETNNQNITIRSSWRDNLEKCYLNTSGSRSTYLDVFYKYGRFIQDSMLHYRAKSSGKLAFKKLKKKKSRKRKDLRTFNNVCRMKNGCCLRCWLSFEFKMCIPRFNWLLVNVTHNGVHLQRYSPFPDGDFGKEKLLLEDVEKQLDDKAGSEKSRESGDEYEKHSVNGVKMPEDKKESEVKGRDDYKERGSLESKYNRLRAKRRGWLKSSERTVEKLLRLKKSNMEDDLSVDKVTKIIDEKSKEQLIKIQTLELSISKLENRILREQLSKTNDSSSITRLENHILRLENELIKINQTYVELRQENEQLKKGQRRYLELSQGPKKNDSKVSTEQASVNYTLVIGKYETRLTDLTYQLRNQSELVSKFKKQLEQVEDQNRILYQIVMNQSLLISQVMKKIQSLSDQIQDSYKNKHEGSGLMTPTELIKHLENMVNINRKSRQRKKRASSPRKHNSSQTLKYHYYKTCMSKTCSKFDVLDRHKVQILSTSNRQMKGGLPKSATVKISNYEADRPGKKMEKEKKEEKPKNSDVVKDEKKFDVKSKPQAKTEKTEAKVSVSSEKKRDDDKFKEKKAKAKADDNRVEKSMNVEKGSKEKILPDSNVVNVAGTGNKAEKVTSGKNIASGRKKPLYEDPENKDSKDCYELYQKGNNRNGAYKIKPAGFKKFIEVFCDMKNGGWTVIQRRQGGTTNFFRDWSMYKKGFGGVYGEHWIGNDVIHHLTNQKECKLRIDLTDWNKNKVTAFYNYFMVEHESEGYLLHVEGFSGEGGDSFSKHNLNKFSTKDVDNDRVTKQFGGSCANRFSGAWWYHKCYSSNLNGVFYRNGVVAEKKFDGVAWKSWKGPNYSMMKTEMKIAPVTGDMK